MSHVIWTELARYLHRALTWLRQIKRMTSLGQRSRRLVHFTWRLTVTVLTVVGLACVAGRPLARVASGWMYETVEMRRLTAPDDMTTALVQVTRGGMGTVLTTRVVLTWPGGTQVIYENGDSPFEPCLTWQDEATLVVGLPCGRIDHLSTPGAEGLWRIPTPVQVRFHYVERCG